MIKIYGSSVRRTHALARLILDERIRFRRRPGSRRGPRADGDQLSLIDDASDTATVVEVREHDAPEHSRVILTVEPVSVFAVNMSGS